MSTRKRWLVAAVGTLLCLVLAVSLFNRLTDVRRSVRQTLCVHNLKMFATAMAEYAKDHDGHFPDRASALYPDYLPMLECYVCPELAVTHKREWDAPHPFADNPTADDIDRLCSYALVPGLSVNDDKSKLIMYEKADNHHGMGRSLLYLDGHGAWEPPENWRDGPANVNLPEELSQGKPAQAH